jgi:hypothetical protein
MNAGAKKFISDVATKCVESGITLKLISDRTVDVDSIPCSGYFDEDDLVVATKKKDWLDVLAHESCHLDQFVEKSKYWIKGDEGIKNIEKYLSKNKSITYNKVKKSIIDTILLELDCEIRTVKKIKKYKLNVNIDTYIKQANSYLFSYWVILRDRRWYPFPYNNPKIYNKFPSNFLQVSDYKNDKSDFLKYFK